MKPIIQIIKKGRHYYLLFKYRRQVKILRKPFKDFKAAQNAKYKYYTK